MCHNLGRGRAHSTRADRRRRRRRHRRRARDQRRLGGRPARPRRGRSTPATTAPATPTSATARTVDHAANGFDPHEIARDFDWGTHEPHGERARAARVGARRARPRDRGRARRAASPPGPTTAASRARRCAAARASGCGSRSSTAPSTRTRSTSTASTRPRWTACPGSARARSSRAARPSTSSTPCRPGLHLYHCHVRPLAEHIAKGLYGAFIVDPKERREDADELVMVMNGFDTNFDRANELYAANTIPFAYMNEPIAGPARRADPALPRQRARVRPDQLVPPAREPVRLLPDRARRGRRPSSPTR